MSAFWNQVHKHVPQISLKSTLTFHLFLPYNLYQTVMTEFEAEYLTGNNNIASALCFWVKIQQEQLASNSFALL